MIAYLFFGLSALLCVNFDGALLAMQETATLIDRDDAPSLYGALLSVQAHTHPLGDFVSIDIESSEPQGNLETYGIFPNEIWMKILELAPGDTIFTNRDFLRHFAPSRALVNLIVAALMSKIVYWTSPQARAANREKSHASIMRIIDNFFKTTRYSDCHRLPHQDSDLDDHQTCPSTCLNRLFHRFDKIRLFYYDMRRINDAVIKANRRVPVDFIRLTAEEVPKELKNTVLHMLTDVQPLIQATEEQHVAQAVHWLERLGNNRVLQAVWTLLCVCTFFLVIDIRSGRCRIHFLRFKQGA